MVLGYGRDAEVGLPFLWLPLLLNTLAGCSHLVTFQGDSPSIIESGSSKTRPSTGKFGRPCWPCFGVFGQHTRLRSPVEMCLTLVDQCLLCGFSMGHLGKGLD